MKTLIALLSIGLFIAASLALYYSIQYKKLLNEYSELDKEYQKWKFERACEKARKNALKKALDKYHKEPGKKRKDIGRLNSRYFLRN